MILILGKKGDAPPVRETDRGAKGHEGDPGLEGFPGDRGEPGRPGGCHISIGVTDSLMWKLFL